ncbi:hypothetical protein N8940_02490 [Sphingomonadaceae bacterium]|nr:hypothetical protein [Sphingomonadaceae bacterium]
MRSLSNFLIATICALAFAATGFAQEPADSDTETSEDSLIGSYRLAGVMETASRLLLEANGTYKWTMIVGNLDLYSEGKWEQIDGQVILGAHQFPSEDPVFVLGSSSAWGREETTAAYEMDHIQLKNRAKWNCGFLEAGAYFEGYGEADFPEDLQPSEQYDAAVQAEREMHKKYADAIAAYFARDKASTDDREELLARTARQNWEHAVAFLAASGRAVNKTGQYQPPLLPAECLFLSDYTPAYSEAGNNPDVDWNYGVGVWINRRDRPNARLNIDAEFAFADGSVEMANSYELGFAFAPAAFDKALSSIKLTLRHDGQEYSSRFEVPAERNARVYEVRLDNRVFVEPPFEELRLDISGDRLLSAHSSGGYYTKSN